MKRSRDFQSFVAKLKCGPVAMCFVFIRKKTAAQQCYVLLLPSYSFQTTEYYSLCYLFVL